MVVETKARTGSRGAKRARMLAKVEGMDAFIRYHPV